MSTNPAHLAADEFMRTLIGHPWKITPSEGRLFTGVLVDVTRTSSKPEPSMVLHFDVSGRLFHIGWERIVAMSQNGVVSAARRTAGSDRKRRR